VRMCSQAQKEASLTSPGMRMLPEEERLEMLQLLGQSQVETGDKIRVRRASGHNDTSLWKLTIPINVHYTLCPCACMETTPAP
jgi:hypothetical protein